MHLGRDGIIQNKGPAPLDLLADVSLLSIQHHLST